MHVEGSMDTGVARVAESTKASRGALARIALCVLSVGLVAAAAEAQLPLEHGVSITIGCEGPKCVDGMLECTCTVCNADQCDDSIIIRSVYFVITDGYGNVTYVPPLSSGRSLNILVGGTVGNTNAVPGAFPDDSAIPLVVGPPSCEGAYYPNPDNPSDPNNIFIPLDGLEGEPGCVQFGFDFNDPDMRYDITEARFNPDDPDIEVYAMVVWEDIGDHCNFNECDTEPPEGEQPQPSGTSQTAVISTPRLGPIDGSSAVCPGVTQVTYCVSEISGHEFTSLEYGWGIIGDAEFCDDPVPGDACVCVNVHNVCDGSFALGVAATGDGCVSDEVSMVVFVRDTEPPVVECPDNVLDECAGDHLCASTVAEFKALGGTVSDNCAPEESLSWSGCSDEYATDELLMECGIDPTGIDPECARIKRTYFIADACGNIGECSYCLVFCDKTDPTIECPPDCTVGCQDSLDPYDPEAPDCIRVLPKMWDNCELHPDTPLTYADEWIEENQCSTGVIERTWTVMDSSGRTSSCTQRITIEDGEAPLVTLPPGPIVVLCEEDMPDCDDPNHPVDPNMWIYKWGGGIVDDCCPLGEITIECDCDEGGHKDAADGRDVISCSFIVCDAFDHCSYVGSVEFDVCDTEPPVITRCPDPINVHVPPLPIDNYTDWYLAGGQVTDDCTPLEDLVIVHSGDEQVHSPDLPAGQCLMRRYYTVCDACGHCTPEPCPQDIYYDCDPVPTVSEWGLIVIGLLLLTGITIALRPGRAAVREGV